MKTVTYTLPSYWASYLINSDAFAIDPVEAEIIDSWLADNNLLGSQVSCDDEWFSHTHDAYNVWSLGGNVSTYTFIV